MKVFWSRCGHGHGNFGDKLTPLFLDLLQLRYEWAAPEEADLIGIGSLLEKIPDDFEGVVWTTGSMFESTRKTLPGAKILAVRGNLTAKILGTKPTVTTGDGGLLCHLISERCKKQFKVGIIPHFVDQENAALKDLVSRHSEICVIDVCAPTLEVIQNVGACEHILSSSLHGLILADSLEIPNQWIEFKGSAGAISGAGFKFRDYYSNFGLHVIQAMQVSGAESLDSFLKPLAQYSRPNIGAIKAGLLESLEQLANEFGGTVGNRVPLEQFLAEEKRKDAGRQEWNSEVTEVIAQLEKMAPADERFILIDEEQIRHQVRHAPAIPLIEQNGEYWGPPIDDDHAIHEARRHRASGIRHLAVTKDVFWWLEQYPEFGSWLHSNSEIVFESQSLKLFRLR